MHVSPSRRFSIVITIGLMLAGCGDDSKPKSASREGVADENGPVTAPKVKFEIGDATLTSPLGDFPLDDAVTAAVMKPVTEWAQTALVDPLAGSDAGNLDTAFSPEASASLAGDSAVMSNTTLGTMTKPITIDTQRVSLIAIGDPTNPSVVAVNIALSLKSASADGAVNSTHIGEFSLKNLDGWKIVAYDIATQRSGDGVPAAAASSSDISATGGSK